MKQEDKELLFKDLCGRLPYAIKIAYRCNHIHELRAAHKSDTILVTDIITDECITTSIENVTPYLFPMSSMTEEQKKEFANLLVYSSSVEMIQITGESTYDWLNKNMFDWRGLIPKGLAINATGLNIY